MSRGVKAAYIVALLVMLAAPLVVVAGVSLNAGQSLRFPPPEMSLRWYGALLTEADWLQATRNSLTIAALSGLIAVAVALPIALNLWTRGNLLGRGLYALGVAPFMLPPVISAVGFLVFWISMGLYGQLPATVVSHGIFLVTLPLVTISLGLQGIDRELVDAARTMGATPGRVLATLVLPLIVPYLISGYAFAFVLSLNEYIIAYMVAGFTVETLPIKIFNSLRYGYTPVMAVVSVIFVVAAVMVFGLIGYFGDLPRLLGAERGKDAG